MCVGGCWLLVLWGVYFDCVYLLFILELFIFASICRRPGPSRAGPGSHGPGLGRFGPAAALYFYFSRMSWIHLGYIWIYDWYLFWADWGPMLRNQQMRNCHMLFVVCLFSLSTWGRSNALQSVEAGPDQCFHNNVHALAINLVTLLENGIRYDKHV